MFVSTFEQFIKNMKQKMRKFPSPQGRKLRTTGAYVTTSVVLREKQHSFGHVSQLECALRDFGSNC